MTIVYGRRQIMTYQTVQVTTDTPEEMARVLQWLEQTKMIPNGQTYRHMGTYPGFGDDEGKWVSRFIRLNQVVADSERGDVIVVGSGAYNLNPNPPFIEEGT